MLAGGQGILLATPAHIGGFIAGLLLQRPLLVKGKKAIIGRPKDRVASFVQG